MKAALGPQLIVFVEALQKGKKKKLDPYYI